MPQPLCRVLVLLSCALASSAPPPYFATVANQALRLQGGAQFGGELNLRAIGELERQVKRVMGADPGLELNVSALRDRPDPELLRILFLAMLGNYTSGSSAEWGRPCTLAVNPETGRVVSLTPAPLESLALKAVLVLLVAVQVKQWVTDARAPSSPTPPAPAQGGIRAGRG